jgi:hypothetical protein
MVRRVRTRRQQGFTYGGLSVRPLEGSPRGLKDRGTSEPHGFSVSELKNFFTSGASGGRNAPSTAATTATFSLLPVR